MDEDTAIINSNTRNEKIKNFFLKNKSKLILITLIIFIISFGYFGYQEINKKKQINISNKYNLLIDGYKKKKNQEIVNGLIDIINQKNKTYSPLSLYFIIDNNLISEKNKVNNLFDILIDKISFEKEIKNLIIYKKALYNADISDENDLLKILKPILNFDSIWKSHGLYLMAEFFYSKGEKLKSKEFFEKIILLENVNLDIKSASQKRLNRDLSE